MRKKFFFLFLLLSSIFIFIFSSLGSSLRESIKKIFISPEQLATLYKEVPSFSPTPSPKPLTFAQMNTLYGPCVYLPTLMYHHIQDSQVALEKKQQNLSVSTEYFRSQMKYLKDKGYSTLSMADLVNFFNQGTAVPKKGVLITFDDGYDDFATNAMPILNEFGFSATVFLSTGLMDNQGYLGWKDVMSFSPSTILFANHTWSHKNMQTSQEKIEFEIQTADFHLSEKGLNTPKIFAYPYGLVSNFAKSYLDNLGYEAAFSTRYGATLCKKQRFDLPRIRVGNTGLSSYGL